MCATGTPWEEARTLRLTFFGVRGSCPCSGPSYQRYGGNTSCILVETDAGEPLILDLGSGLRPLGQELLGRAGGRPRGSGTRGPAERPLPALLTHLHWDHLIGLPFFAPIHRPDGSMEVYGPAPAEGGLHELIDQVVQPPFFPVQVRELHGSVAFHEVADEEFEVAGALVRARRVPHVGSTLGFRIEVDGMSVAYISDHQAPFDRVGIAPAVLELCDGADVVVHDAQYTDEEFERRADWGHSTVGYAVRVAAEAGARSLILFHHDPGHGDEDLDRLLDEARRCRRGDRPERVTAAAEGLVVEVSTWSGRV